MHAARLAGYLLAPTGTLLLCSWKVTDELLCWLVSEPSRACAENACQPFEQCTTYNESLCGLEYSSSSQVRPRLLAHVLLACSLSLAAPRRQYDS